MERVMKKWSANRRSHSVLFPAPEGADTTNNNTRLFSVPIILYPLITRPLLSPHPLGGRRPPGGV
jgi:hypothetical protein